MKNIWVQELRDNKTVKIHHIDTANNPADLLTKPHSASKFVKLLGMCNPIKIKN